MNINGALVILAVLIVAAIPSACGLDDPNTPGTMAYEQRMKDEQATREKAAFKARCEQLGGIVVKRATENWFSGTHYSDDCALPGTQR
jgi:hypothetical protein